MDSAGKVFIVTGAASSLGEGTARMRAAHGGKVVVANDDMLVHQAVTHALLDGEVVRLDGAIRPAPT